MDIYKQVITIRRGEDAVIPFGPNNVNITGWGLQFNLSTSAGSALITGFPITPGTGNIIVGDPTHGGYTVTIPAALTALLTSGLRYEWDVWRTDIATLWPLASGPLIVVEPVHRP